MKTIVPILAVALMLASQVLSAEEKDELGLREYLLNKKFAIYAKTNGVCYISFGSSLRTNLNENIGISTQGFTVVFTTPPPEYQNIHTAIELSRPSAIHTDPPSDFLKRFEGRHFTVKPASQYPKSKNKNDQKKYYPDGLYTIAILEWSNATTARIRYSIYIAPLWANGSEAIVEKQNGTWRIEEIKGTGWMQ